MTEEIKPKRKLGKKAACELERNQEIARLEGIYDEGKSNIDFSKMDLGQRNARLAALLGGSPLTFDLPLISKADWLKRNLTDWEEKRPRVPPGKVQDPAAKLAKYRQKFVEAVRQHEPQALEYLRPLGLIFQRLFKNQSGQNYLKILEDLRTHLVSHRLPDDRDFDTFDHDYVWGETYKTFLFAREKFLATRPKYDRRFEESMYAFIERYSYALDPFNRTVELAFCEAAESPESILSFFFLMQDSIYLWAENYSLKKDWLIDYAYYLIFQFSKNEGLAVQDLEIGPRSYSQSALYSAFEFKANGWLASEEGETARQYRTRVTREFTENLEEYLIEASRFLRLKNFTLKTKPPTFESVEWLVHSTVKKWSAERIVEKFFPAITRTTPAGHRAFKSKKKHVEIEMRKLEIYKLPVSI
jgi:hypothetical protein